MSLPSDGVTGRPRLGVHAGFLVVLSPLSQLGFTPVSVVLGEELGLNVGQVGLTVGLYAAAAALATIVLGPVFDLVSPRRILPVAVAANVVLSASLLLEPGFAGILAARVLTGVTNSALMLCAAVVVADANRGDATARERGFSRLQTFTSVGAVVGLGVGAAAAGLGRPHVWSWTVVGYGLLVLVLAPLIARRMPAAVRAVGGSPGVRLAAVLREVGAALRVPRTFLVLLAAAGVGWAIQATHYAVSLLSEQLQPPLWQRVLLAMGPSPPRRRWAAGSSSSPRWRASRRCPRGRPAGPADYSAASHPRSGPNRVAMSVRIWT